MLLPLALVGLLVLFWLRLRSGSGQSQVSLRSLWAYFVSKTEPKILRLVSSLGPTLPTLVLPFIPFPLGTCSADF